MNPFQNKQGHTTKTLLYSLLGATGTAQATGFSLELTSRQTSVSLSPTAQAPTSAQGEPSIGVHSGQRSGADVILVVMEAIMTVWQNPRQTMSKTGRNRSQINTKATLTFGSLVTSDSCPSSEEQACLLGFCEWLSAQTLSITWVLPVAKTQLSVDPMA